MTQQKDIRDHILDSIGEGVFTVDKSFRISFFNRAAERITGYRREDVIGKFCKNIFKTHKCFDECPITLVLTSGKNLYSFESSMSNRDGDKVPVVINSSLLRDGNNVAVGGIVTFRDIAFNEYLKKDLDSETQFCGIIGKSKSMQELFSLIREIAATDATVFIRGESGTGKEMIANAIQMNSNRAGKPFIKVNCSVFPEGLLASELFGHVKGAFTDAIKERTGRFEMADGGTIFLDEVAEMPLQMQIQLLRVLQEGTFERVGESKTRKVDVRVIAATNIDLQLAIAQGKFREDLYYRLNVIPIEVPPLRERKEDIPRLMHYFMKKFSLIYHREEKDFADETIDAMLKYDWFGNVRELENVIEYLFVRSGDATMIQPQKLPPHIREFRKAESLSVRKVTIQSTQASDPANKTLLAALEKHHWNKSLAAKELGIGRTTLWRMMKRAGIE